LFKLIGLVNRLLWLEAVFLIILLLVTVWIHFLPKSDVGFQRNKLMIIRHFLQTYPTKTKITLIVHVAYVWVKVYAESTQIAIKIVALSLYWKQLMPDRTKLFRARERPTIMTVCFNLPLFWAINANRSAHLLLSAVQAFPVECLKSKLSKNILSNLLLKKQQWVI